MLHEIGSNYCRLIDGRANLVFAPADCPVCAVSAEHQRHMERYQQWKDAALALATERERREEAEALNEEKRAVIAETMSQLFSASAEIDSERKRRELAEETVLRLSTECDDARRENARLREALAWYAETVEAATTPVPLMDVSLATAPHPSVRAQMALVSDGGKRARAALGPAADAPGEEE